MDEEDAKIENEDDKREVNSKDIKSKQNKQMMFIIILMAIIFISLLIPYVYDFIMQNYVNGVEYNGIKFRKSVTGNLVFYESDIPIVNQENKTIEEYTVRFKTNPIELAKIPIDKKIEKDGIKFIKDESVYISINPNMANCSDNGIALFDFSAFLSDSGLKVKPAFTNKSYANESGYPYIDCQHSSKNTIIKIDSGNKTEIIRERTNCYKIVYNKCEIIPAIERFNLRIIEDYLNSTKKDDGLIKSIDNQTLNETEETDQINN